MNQKGLLSAKEVVEKLDITIPILNNWQTKNILIPVNPENGKRYFKTVDVNRILGLNTPPPEGKRGIEAITQTAAMQSIFFATGIRNLDAKSKSLILEKGDLTQLKNLKNPSLEDFENIFLGLRNISHMNFIFSGTHNLKMTDLEHLMEQMSSIINAPIIVLMNTDFNRKILEIQEDGKLIVNAKNLPSALNILNNHLNTIQ